MPQTAKPNYWKTMLVIFNRLGVTFSDISVICSNEKAIHLISVYIICRSIFC